MSEIPAFGTIPSSDALREPSGSIEELMRRASEILSQDPETANLEDLILLMRKQAEEWKRMEESGETRRAQKASKAPMPTKPLASFFATRPKTGGTQ